MAGLRVFESGTNEENNGDMRRDGFIWTASNLEEGEREGGKLGRPGICYRSQLPMMPKSKTRGRESSELVTRGMLCVNVTIYSTVACLASRGGLVPET